MGYSYRRKKGAFLNATRYLPVYSPDAVTIITFIAQPRASSSTLLSLHKSNHRENYTFSSLSFILEYFGIRRCLSLIPAVVRSFDLPLQPVDPSCGISQEFPPAVATWAAVNSSKQYSSSAILGLLTVPLSFSFVSSLVTQGFPATPVPVLATLHGVCSKLNHRPLICTALKITSLCRPLFVRI